MGGEFGRIGDVNPPPPGDFIFLQNAKNSFEEKRMRRLKKRIGAVIAAVVLAVAAAGEPQQYVDGYRNGILILKCVYFFLLA